MNRVCRARGTRILFPHFPSAEALGFLISSRRADWGRVAQMGRVCRARGTRILFPHFPSAEALGFPISSRRAGLGPLRLVSLCHRTRRVERLSQRTCRTERPGRSIGKPTASAVGKRSSTAGVPRGRHMPHHPNPQRTPRHHRRHRATPRSFFRTTPEFWLNLQSLYEIRIAPQKSGKSIKTPPTLRGDQLVRA